MKIELIQRFKSLPPFVADDLPAFVLLTGENGSGKTQLLKAFEQKRIRLDDMEFIDVRGTTQYFDANSFVGLQNPPLPADRAGISVVQRQRAADAIDKITSVSRKLVDQLRTEASISDADVALLVKVSRGAIPARHVNPPDNLKLLEPLDDCLKKCPSFGEWLEFANHAAGKCRKPPQLLTREDVEDAGEDLVPLVSMAFVRSIETYRDKWLHNRLLQLANTDGNFESTARTDEEFTDRYGRPPWNIVEDALAEMGVHTKVAPPDLYQFSAYSPRLILQSGETIEPEDLSAGEKTLLTIALMAAHKKLLGDKAAGPAVFLLDEIDTALHPKNVRRFLGAIQRIVITELGCKVLMVTHSPSTVALFPGESVYIVDKSQQVPLQKRTKQQAINALTVGVPTLSLSFDGNRQVFCEDHTDAEVYTAVYNVLRYDLNSERSLTFISSGTKLSDGSRGTGCENVITLVSSLRDGGNRSVFGLLDGDGKRRSDGPLITLGDGGRYSLENYILDPRLLAATLIAVRSGIVKQLGLPGTQRSLAAATLQDHQTYIDAIQAFLFEKSADDLRKQEVEYIDGKKLMIADDVCQMNGHDFAQLVLERFEFRPITKDLKGRKAEARLVEHISSCTVPEFPGFLPRDILVTFNSLLELE